ncbi:MAG: hypothetical protein J6T57_01425 [Alphaproteobacteria bacterium]|nr:hypothetical protein [Alphaproteobacteria bacterium]
MSSEIEFSAHQENQEWRDFKRRNPLPPFLIGRAVIVNVRELPILCNVVRDARQHVKQVYGKMNEYKSGNCVIPKRSDADKKFEKLDSILVKYMSRKNPGICDYFIANPGSVQDKIIAEAVLLGYLKKHTDEAQRILDTVNPEFLSETVRRRANLHAMRLKNFELSY